MQAWDRHKKLLLLEQEYSQCEEINWRTNQSVFGRQRCPVGFPNSKLIQETSAFTVHHLFLILYCTENERTSVPSVPSLNFPMHSSLWYDTNLQRYKNCCQDHRVVGARFNLWRDQSNSPIVFGKCSLVFGSPEALLNSRRKTMRRIKALIDVVFINKSHCAAKWWI